ncbi:MAG: siderophore-interacting protein [Siphonobacter aquaeclarae]|nr:siderophore-interacting protein [Siphonobacter aquaeclarae]
MKKWIGDAMESLMGSRMPHMQVLTTEYLSPEIKRIRFGGAISGMNFEPGHAVAIRVSDTEYRNYTPSYSDTAAGLVDIIFHLHGHGPGSDLANRLQTGDSLRISMPRGWKHYDPTVRNQVVFGDETSLGLASILFPLFRANGHRFQFLLELDECNRDVPARLGLENVSIFPKSQAFRDEEQIRALSLLRDPEWRGTHYLLTGNVTSVRTFRNVLREQRHTVRSQGYWLEGKMGL